MTTLRSNQIILVKQHPDHAEGLFAALVDPRIYAFLDEGPPESVDAVRQRIQKLLHGGSPDKSEIWLNWSVFKNETIVGYTQATITNETQASIAYVFSPGVWGTGVAQNAVELTITELAEQHSVLKLTADTEGGNYASQKLLNRLGFSKNRHDSGDLFYERNI